MWRMTAPRDGCYCMPHFTDGDGHGSGVYKIKDGARFLSKVRK